MTQYRALVGIDYPPDKRAEAGELVSDLPEKSVTWLLAQGLIETTDGKPSKKSAAKVEEPVVEVKEETPVIEKTEVQVPEATENKRNDKDKEYEMRFKFLSLNHK